MATIRRLPEQAHFTIIANQIMRDPRLSLRALGVLVRLLSEPPDSTINTATLQAERPGKEGRDAILTVLREIEAAGYLTRPRRRGPGGRLRTEWVVSSIPEMPEDATTPIRMGRGALALLTHPDPPLSAGSGPTGTRVFAPAWPVDEPPETVDNRGDFGG